MIVASVLRGITILVSFTSAKVKRSTDVAFLIVVPTFEATVTWSFVQGLVARR